MKHVAQDRLDLRKGISPRSLRKGTKAQRHKGTKGRRRTTEDSENTEINRDRDRDHDRDRIKQLTLAKFAKSAKRS